MIDILCVLLSVCIPIFACGENINFQQEEADPFSGVDFTSYKSEMSKEDYAALESYFPILNEDCKFTFQNMYKNESSVINLHELYEMSSALIELYSFTVWDIDDDNVKELILSFDPVGEMVIFHKENNDFYATEQVYRGFKQLQKNGVYNSSGGAPCNHYLKLFFENGKFSETELGHGCAYEDDMFVVNGNPVSEEEFKQWHEEIMVGKVEWYYEKLD